MTYYYPKVYFDSSKRWHIFPLLKVLQKEPNGVFGSLELTEDIEKADSIILPMSWNYYYTHKLNDEVLSFIDTISFKNKPILSFVFGDFGVKVPKKYKGFVFRTSGRKHKLPFTHKGIPIFVEDPVLKYYKGQNIFERPYSEKPVIGFCGQAKGFGFQTIKEYLKINLKNLLSFFHIRHIDKDQLMSTTYFRWNILKALNKSSKLTCNFIIRDKYRAGIKAEKETHPSTLQFYDNIKDSDYVVCMRGAGNFSTRFYETLAMGRIPVFVNTDCLLPLENQIDWKSHVVWVDYLDRHRIVDKIIEFHSRLDEKSLCLLLKKNRRLWEEHLQLYPFFNTFFNEV